MPGEAVQFDVSSKVDDAIRNMERVVGSVERMAGSVKKMAEETRKQRTATVDADSALSKIGSYAASFLTVTAAVGLFRKALADMRAESIEAGQQLAQMDEAMKALALDSAKPSEYRKVAGVGASAARQGLMSHAEAMGFAQQAESLGLGADMGALLKGVKAGIKGEPLVESIAALTRHYGAQGIPVEKTINQLVAGARPSKIKPEEFGLMMTRTAPGIAARGGTQEEAIAFLAALSVAMDEPRQAAAILNTLTTAMEKGKIGGGLFEGLEAIERMSATRRKKIGAEGPEFDLVRKLMPEIRRTYSEIVAAGEATGTGQAPLDQAIAIQKGTPIEALRKKRAAANVLEEKMREEGEREARRDRAILQERIRVRDRGEGWFESRLRMWPAYAAKGLGLGPEYIAAAGEMATLGTKFVFGIDAHDWSRGGARSQTTPPSRVETPPSRVETPPSRVETLLEEIARTNDQTAMALMRFAAPLPFATDY